MKTLALTILLLTLATPALAQEGVGMIEDFSALPSPASESKFDITSVDFLKEIPASYPLGPGDVLVIDLGNIAGDQDTQMVSAQGDLLLPVVGKVPVAGLTVAEATATLDAALRPYLRNYELSLAVSRQRKIEVIFTGMVQTPGTYLAFGGTSLSHFMQIVSQKFTEEPLNTALPQNEFLSRTNNRFHALLPEGSFRRVQVWRDGELFRTVDLARVMVFGDTDKDLFLEQGDRVHVPGLEKFVVFDDAAPFPGKIELLPGDQLHELVKLMGGPQSFATNEAVTVQRGSGLEATYYQVRLRDSVLVQPFREEVPEPGLKPSSEGTRSLEAHYAARAEWFAALPPAEQPGAPFKLSGGEVVRMTRPNEVIYLTGAFGRPGAYVFRTDYTILDYIGQSGGIYPGGQEGEARWIRRGPPGEPPLVQYISLKDVMLGEAPMPSLQPGDMLFIPSKNNQWGGPTLLQTLLNFGTQVRFFTQ